MSIRLFRQPHGRSVFPARLIITSIRPEEDWGWGWG